MISIIPKKTALVTGVSSGIGRAVAALLAEQGYRTFGTVRGDAPAQANVEHVRLDVRDPDSIARAVGEVLARTGRIDVLVHAAGASVVGAAEETSVAEARELFDVNFFGVLRMTQAVLPTMRAQRSGRIVTITSVLGFLPAPFMSIYAATKHALEGWSQSLDHEVRGFGIRAITVEPAFTRTELANKARAAERHLDDYETERDRVATRVAEAIAHGAEPETVAEVVLRAITARAPHLTYPVGRRAKSLRMLRSLAPDSLVDDGVRKAFGLAGASV